MKKYIPKRQNEKINIYIYIYLYIYIYVYIYIYIIERDTKIQRKKVGLSSFYSFDFKM